MRQLSDEKCVPYPPGARALTLDEARQLARHLHGEWTIDRGGRSLRRLVRFADYHRTIGFVNALAYVAHQEDHHPSLLIGFDSCLIVLDTHTVGGLSRNDFIVAARADRLLPPD